MRISTSTLVMFLVVATGTAGAREADPAPLHVDLTLTDGSRITGTAPDGKITLIAPYGRLDLALCGVARIALRDDRETVRILMRNEDVLRGVLGDGHIEVHPYRAGEPRKVRFRDVCSLRVTPPLCIAGSEDVRWEVSYDHTHGWVTSNRGGSLTVTHIDPAVVNRASNGPWSTVRLTRAIRPRKDLDLTAHVSWDSGPAGRDAMQNVRVALLDEKGREIVEVGHNDAWSGYTGSKYSWIAGAKKEAGYGTQPLAGRARIEIVRREGEVTVNWNGEPLQTCRIETPVHGVQVRFDFYAYRGRFYAYRGRGVESDFGTVVLESLELR